MTIGFIKLHRKILEWEWYSDNNTRSLFFHLLLTANYEPKKWRGFEIKEGELVTSLENLSKETGLSFQQTRTAISKLKSTNEITSSATANYTLITIVKWKDYQEDNKRNNNKITINQQATQHPNNNNLRSKEVRSKEKKESKNISSISDFEEFWNLYPRKDASKTAREKYQSAIKEGTTHATIIAGLAKHNAEWINWSDTDRKYIPQAATWLFQQRWNDEPFSKAGATNKLTDYEIGIQNAIQYQVDKARDGAGLESDGL